MVLFPHSILIDDLHRHHTSYNPHEENNKKASNSSMHYQYLILFYVSLYTYIQAKFQTGMPTTPNRKC